MCHYRHTQSIFGDSCLLFWGTYHSSGWTIDYMVAKLCVLQTQPSLDFLDGFVGLAGETSKVFYHFGEQVEVWWCQWQLYRGWGGISQCHLLKRRHCGVSNMYVCVCVCVCVWYQASATKQMRTALFWVIMQWVVVISYRHFGTAYRSHLWGSRIQKNPKWFLNPEDGTNSLSWNVGKKLPQLVA